MAEAASTRGEPRTIDVRRIVQRLRCLAIRALARMYRPEQHLFAFRIRRTGAGDVLEGVSRRYTAIVVIGLAEEADDVASTILAGHSVQDLCGRLLGDVGDSADLGQVALALWAARALQHPGASIALERLRSMDPGHAPFPTVELAWSLAALTVAGIDAADGGLAEQIVERLLSSFRQSSALFPHWPDGAGGSFLRSHVTCFADLVYPIYALSHYYRTTGNAEALDAACRCAERMVELQGPEGQWWWHYDVRTARVLERYPVYAVHQDAMAPMALHALRDAGGVDHSSAIKRGLAWLINAAETPVSLIDHEAGLVWRKVGRHEPRKLSRGAQALASRVHPHLRVPGLDFVFCPGSVDYESRPYHMGWILRGWCA